MGEIVVNGRFLSRRVTGVERHGREILALIKDRCRVETTRKNGMAGHAWEQFVLPAKLRADDLLWSPANSGPWLARRQAVTIHDASPFDHPEWFDPRFAAWTRLSWKILAKTAAAIITVSNFSRERLRFHLGVEDKKLFVVPNGVGKPFEPQSRQTVEAALARYGIKPPYFLFVGTLEPRKNLGRLFEAWKSVQPKLPRYSLVVAGETGAVFRGKGFFEAPDNSQFLGYVPDADLAALYTGARALLAPSLYEGFCLPALEAMACGTPVIASNAASLPEVTDGAARLVNPLEPRQIAEAMRIFAENEALANQYRERGLTRARKCRWEDSAGKLQSVLERLHD